MLVKVCGITNLDNLNAIVQSCAEVNCLPEFFGFISYLKSKRVVTPEVAINLAKSVPVGVARVLVSVDETSDYLRKYLDSGLFDYIQLHGNEDLEYVEDLRIAFPNLKIIKAISILGSEDLARANGIGDKVDYFLFDTKGDQPGGNGVKFSWDLLTSKYSLGIPYFLSGGIAPEDVQAIKTFSTINQRAIAIDLNSRFEISPGIKDPIKLKNFILGCKI